MQYKAAMLRMLEKGESGKSFTEAESSSQPTPVDNCPPAWAQYCLDNVDTILYCFVPLMWSFLFVLIMDRDLVYDTIYMPFLGVFAACLANTVPIGGGIVYIPALYILGMNMTLGVSFTVATMSFGNGVFGFLIWLKKDPSNLIWESFLYTVIPSSIGSIIGILFIPPPSHEFVQLLFGVFSLTVAVFVARTAYLGGLEDEKSAVASENVRPPLLSTHQAWVALALVSFLAGGVLVPHIGIGPALTTYLGLSIMGYPTRAAAITSIVTGGWVSVVPFVIHAAILADVPYAMWLMVIPGIFLGAKLSPLVHDYVGIRIILLVFTLLLKMTAVMFLFSTW